MSVHVAWLWSRCGSKTNAEEPHVGGSTESRHRGGITMTGRRSGMGSLWGFIQASSIGETTMSIASTRSRSISSETMKLILHLGAWDESSQWRNRLMRVACWHHPSLEILGRALRVVRMRGASRLCPNPDRALGARAPLGSPVDPPSRLLSDWAPSVPQQYCC